jgi:hypothetical protein
MMTRFKTELKNRIQDWKMRHSLAHSFEPSQAQFSLAKKSFLQSVHEEFGLSFRKTRWVHYSLAIIIGILIVNGSAVIFADTRDVPPESPLYTYKRVGEDIRVVLAPKEKKAEVEASITARRGRELKAVVAELASSTPQEKDHEDKEQKVKKLKEDIKHDLKNIDDSVKALKPETQNIKKSVVCSNLKDLEDEDTGSLINTLCPNSQHQHDKVNRKNHRD